MNITTCEHAKAAVTLYRVEGELLCIDCVAERYQQLDARVANAHRVVDEIKAERDRLVILVGYSPAGSSRLLNYIKTCERGTVYQLTLADPDGYTRTLKIDADSEEEARASDEIHTYERVVEVRRV